MNRVLVVGSINMDLVVETDEFPAPGETLLGRRFATYPGGKGANQAVAARRLGAQVAMLGCVGCDAFGRELSDRLAAEGIDLRGFFVWSLLDKRHRILGYRRCSPPGAATRSLLPSHRCRSRPRHTQEHAWPECPSKFVARR